MKHQALALASTFSLATLSLVGCAAESADVRATTNAYSNGLNCNDNNGANPMKAALAVAMASEMGRVDPLQDLQSYNSMVSISSAGFQACADNGASGCPNTTAILEMQDAEVNQYIDQNEFNATNFRYGLVASFDRQRQHELNLLWNYPSEVPREHSLVEVGVSDFGACGVHYDYAVDGEDYENIEHRMVFYGGEGNPFIDFRAGDGMISIDPSGTMNGDSDSGSGACTVGCYGYGKKLREQCCSCDGDYGKFKRAPWNSKMVYCAY